jgi:hypothetical protein
MAPNLDKITAPFTAEQVEVLNLHQKCGFFHPFTCGKDSNHLDLVATKAGWVCPGCAYTQTWAWESMANRENIERQISFFKNRGV